MRDVFFIKAAFVIRNPSEISDRDVMDTAILPLLLRETHAPARVY